MIKLLGQLENAKDRTKKWVFANCDNEIIEISLITSNAQDILYIPTHYNCSLGCELCNLKDKCQNQECKPIDYRDLLDAIEQVILPGDKRATLNTKVLLSFRGVGEALQNMPLIEKMYKEKLNFERLGYQKIAFEVFTMMPNAHLEELVSWVREGKYPLRVIYHMTSPVDDKRQKLTPATSLSVDSSLVYLHQFNESIKASADMKAKYRQFFGTKYPVEIYYEIVSDVNDTPFELAILQYFAARYNIPINFAKLNNGEDKWKEDIIGHYPELKVTLSRPMGKDIGCLHGKFLSHLYAKKKSLDNILDYNESRPLKERTIKKVFDNKVV